MNLRARLGLAVAAAASVAIFLMASAFWIVAAREQRQTVDDFLIDRVAQVRALGDIGAPDRGRGRGRGEVQLAPVFDQGEVVRFRFERPDGTVLIDDGLPSASPGRKRELSTVVIDGDRYRMIAAGIGDGNRQGVFQVAQNIEGVERGLSRLRRQIIFGGLLGVGLAGLLGALVAHRLTKPITKVAEAARQMAVRQDLPSRIEVDRSDEVGDLADSFNQMLSALEVSRDQQQRLVADASHELRTPLTSLRLKIDLLDRTPDLPMAQRQELLSGAATELERLTDLVSELVDLAADPGGTEEAASVVELDRLALDVVDGVSRSSGRAIEVEARPHSAPVRERMVRRALTNLLDNAVKYSPAGTEIALTVDRGRFEVLDHGEGIPVEDLEHVFDRFYRSSTARTRPGNGIGLAIVRRVAELHGGEVWARNHDDGGAIVGFSIAMGDSPASTLAASTRRDRLGRSGPVPGR